MSWVKLDDRLHEHRKVRRLWKKNPAALGLHVLALTYCAGHETDGHVDDDFLEDKVPAAGQRRKLTAALTDVGMWEQTDAGWVIHDYLDYNPSRADAAAKRKADADRKARGREQQALRRVGRAPESERTPAGVSAESSGPVPARPGPSTTPQPPTGERPAFPEKKPGNRQRDHEQFTEQLKDYGHFLKPRLGDIAPTEIDGYLGLVIRTVKFPAGMPADQVDDRVVAAFRHRTRQPPEQRNAAA